MKEFNKEGHKQIYVSDNPTSWFFCRKKKTSKE